MNNLLFDKPQNRLEALMQERKYTLRKVSEDTNIPITTLSGYKKNLRTPKKDNAQILSEYFNVSIPYLLGLDDSRQILDFTTENFDKEPPKKRPQAPRKVASQKSPDSYNKKGRFPFSLHHEVRYDKLEELVIYHGAKSASDYLEKMIVQEWEKMRRKLKKR